MPRPLYTIAAEIRTDWQNVNPYAKPYLEAMANLTHITEVYYHDNAAAVVAYFLSNASAWKGDVARRIKKELRLLLDNYYKA
jgi:hypothetical protein